MKTIFILMVTAMVSVLAGCASTPLAIAPVGPNPTLSGDVSSEGGLQVLSSLIGCSEGNNPPWYQHTDYYIYDLQGKLLKHVNNTVGYYAGAPCRVALPAGQYLVKASATDYVWVEIQVTIKRGQTTRVRLDDNWIPPEHASKGVVIRLPNGKAVGWRG